jgi:hypothetical protein
VTGDRGGRTLRDVLARKRELALRSDAQRAEFSRRARELAVPLAWADRGIALAVALRRGAGVLAAFNGWRALFSRPRA